MTYYDDMSDEWMPVGVQALATAGTTDLIALHTEVAGWVRTADNGSELLDFERYLERIEDELFDRLRVRW